MKIGLDWLLLFLYLLPQSHENTTEIDPAKPFSIQIAGRMYQPASLFMTHGGEQ
jgi:hypothetical protein